MTDEPYDASAEGSLPRDEPAGLPLPPGDPAPRPLHRTTPGTAPFGDRGPRLPETAPLSPRQERLYAALAHLSQVAGILVAPVMLLGSVGRESVFVDRHAKEAFNFQATFVLLFVASAVVALRGAGPTVIGVVAAYGMVMAGLAALRSWNGAFFRYPLAIRFLR